MQKHKVYLFRGKQFTEKEILLIKEIIRNSPKASRTEIAKIICEKLSWRQINSNLKIVSCREALSLMEKKDLLKLPPSKYIPQLKYSSLKIIKSEDVNFIKPNYELSGDIKDFSDLRLKLVETSKEKLLWRYLIQEYHYLGYRIIVGRHLKYFVYLGKELVCAIGFGDGILHHKLRDEWIGWDNEILKRNLHFIVNNVRFLILHWIKIKNLASKILSLSSKRLVIDWERKYKYKPCLLETFVEKNRFLGTCYKAANWKLLGSTEGKGRHGRNYYKHGIIKDLYVHPLCKNAKELLRR